MALLEQKGFGWRDVVMLACIVAVAILGIRAQNAQNAVANDNRKAAILVAVSVCQQANVLVNATLAKKTAAERALLKPLITQYLDPLNRALVQLGHPPNCDAK